MQIVVHEENHNKISVVGLWIETGTSTLRLYNNTKLSVTIGVKSYSKASSAYILLLNANNYSVST
jgi:hypothetical protein